MSCAPAISFTRRSKRNPCADRGLAEFKLLSAELEAKRKKLLAQLGTPLSFVRFSVGSDQTKWVPIIICPTLSTGELRALRQAATNLISEERDVFLINAKPTQTGNAKSASPVSTHIPPSVVKSNVSAVGKLPNMTMAAEKFLWMAAFGLSIVADIIRNAFGLKPRVDVHQKRRPISSARQGMLNKELNTSTTTASSVAVSSFLSPPKAALPTTQWPQHIKTNGTSRRPHLKIASAHIKWENAGCVTAPSTPTSSRQLTKPLIKTLSFSKACTLEQDQGMTKQKQLCTTMSPPRMPTCLEIFDPQRGSLSAINKRDKKVSAQKLGQALTGIGVVLGVGGLAMGYFPAIVSIVCWWYLLPTLRKAVGDKPHIVKSHHRQQRS
ncbi:hypothetical protein L7F22_048170 [Adiantum nelumboides]|nr:hypothetical protein [Adiantum nelumboides]